MNHNSCEERSLADWLGYLETLHPNEIVLGLDRIREVASRAGLLDTTSFVITVAGTNGKGTTIATLETIFIQAGAKVGSYTSPHLTRYNERIRLNGVMVSDEALCKSFQLIEKSRQDTPLTYFEFGTLSALLLFKEQALDVILLEVGLGGRLDAVNIIDPDIAVITSIGFDHTDWLGNSLESIAREKSGIARQGKPCICGEAKMPPVAESNVKSLVSPYVSREDFRWQMRNELWDWEGVNRQGEMIQRTSLPIPDMPLANVALALQVLSFSPLRSISDEELRSALKRTSLDGRMQWLVGSNPRKKTDKMERAAKTTKSEASWVVDVAHNPHAAQYLASQIQAVRLHFKKVVAIFSALRDKDRVNVVKALSSSVDQWIVAPLSVARTASVEELVESLEANNIYNGVVYPSLSEAFSEIDSTGEQNTLVVVFGSFYTVAEALQFHGYAER